MNAIRTLRRTLRLLIAQQSVALAQAKPKLIGCKLGRIVCMAIEERGGFWFGTCAADARTFLADHLGRFDWAYAHSPLKGHSGRGQWLYGPEINVCCCKGEVCRLQTDADAYIHDCVCAECGTARSFLPDRGQADSESNPVFFSECECGSEFLNIASGVFVPESNAMPLVLMAVRCTSCGHLECLAVRETATSPNAAAPSESLVWGIGRALPRTNTLYAYAEGNDLHDVADRLDAGFARLIEEGGWVCGQPWQVNQRRDDDPSLGPDDLPDWEIGLNLPLPLGSAEPPGWFADVERIVAALERMHVETGRDFVVGIGHEGRGISEDVAFIGDKPVDRTSLRRAFGAS